MEHRKKKNFKISNLFYPRAAVELRMLQNHLQLLSIVDFNRHVHSLFALLVRAVDISTCVNQVTTYVGRTVIHCERQQVMWIFYIKAPACSKLVDGFKNFRRADFKIFVTTHF